MNKHENWSMNEWDMATCSKSNKPFSLYWELKVAKVGAMSQVPQIPFICIISLQILLLILNILCTRTGVKTISTSLLIIS